MAIAGCVPARLHIVAASWGTTWIRAVPAQVRSSYIRHTRYFATETSLPSSKHSPSSSAASQPSSGDPSSYPTDKAASPPPSPSSASSSASQSFFSKNLDPSQPTENTSLPPGWEDEPNENIAKFSELPHRNFGSNQHMIVNAEFKEALRQVLWRFRAPIRYAFAYGSGVFSQSAGTASSSQKPLHPNPPDAVTKWQKSGAKNIDFIFGVSYSQHWHSLNLQQHRDHYSFLGALGSNVVTKVQENFGAGAYFNTYVVVNGIMIKYGVVNLDTMYRDLSEWDTMYMAGRLQKPVKILRDDPRIRLANQKNLISALRTALLMLPSKFTERDLYTTIASLSYMGDPRMAFRAEDPGKVSNIVDHQMVNFRQLYLPLIDDLPNISFKDSKVTKKGWDDEPDINCKLEQDMSPVRRGNMVRRLPNSFRQKLYQASQREFSLPAAEFRKFIQESKDEDAFSSRMGTEFDQKIAESDKIGTIVGGVVKQTVKWPSMSQSMKGLLTAGVWKGFRYLGEKLEKGRANKQNKAAETETKADSGKET